MYLETTKANRLNSDESVAAASCKALSVCLAIGVDQLEIFAPFLAQELKLVLPSNVAINLKGYIDKALEKRVESLLEICESIRAMKSECRITNRIPSEIQILIKSPDDESFLRSHTENIKVLTFTQDLTMTTSADDFDQEDFIGISTAGHRCSFGVRTLNKSLGKVDTVMNEKKYAKLENELINLMKAVGQEGYKKKAAEKVQLKHKERVRKAVT